MIITIVIIVIPTVIVTSLIIMTPVILYVSINKILWNDHNDT